jgi:hypothetical protein
MNIEVKLGKKEKKKIINMKEEDKIKVLGKNKRPREVDLNEDEEDNFGCKKDVKVLLNQKKSVNEMFFLYFRI